MIPEWMDLIVWGHEHECRIEPSESLIGTFRISQPGSTVATSLCPGEAVRKHAGLLEIKGDNFRLTPQPLASVRGFAMDEVSLGDQPILDAEDPKIDEKITKFLAKQVENLIAKAGEIREECDEAAAQHRAAFEQDGEGVNEPAALTNLEVRSGEEKARDDVRRQLDCSPLSAVTFCLLLMLFTARPGQAQGGAHWLLYAQQSAVRGALCREGREPGGHSPFSPQAQTAGRQEGEKER